jgi:hypothetical protein
MRREGMDKEKYSPIFGGYGTLIQQRNQVGEDTIRFMGDKMADALFRGLAANQGIPQAIAAQYTNVASRMGLMTNERTVLDIRRGNLSQTAATGIFREEGRYGVEAAKQYTSVALWP